MRRAVVEDAGEGSVEVFEALAALRLAAKRIHDAMERFAEGHGLSGAAFVCSRACAIARAASYRWERSPQV
ncbi:MAG TPA: hypothetical protein VFD88_04285 [Clostridia bacterium]|nr:hypothetical protein [Clostridia bacterium]